MFRTLYTSCVGLSERILLLASLDKITKECHFEDGKAFLRLVKHWRRLTVNVTMDLGISEKSRYGFSRKRSSSMIAYFPM